MPLTIKSHVGMGTTAPGSLHRVDTSPTDTSPAAGETFSTSSSGNSAERCALLQGIWQGQLRRILLCQLDEERSRQATNLVS